VRFGVVGLAVMAGVTVLAGCGSSSSGGSSGSAVQAITRAADVSTSAAGYAVTMHLTEDSSSLGGTITAVGTGAFNVPKHAGSLDLNMTLPGALSVIGQLNLDVLTLGNTEYLKVPSQLSTRLPAIKPWVEINLAQVGKASGIPGIGSLLGGTNTVNPAQFLEYLRAVSASGVHKVGAATVDGIATTHYQATLDLDKAPSLLPAAERAQATQAVAALEKLTGLHELPVNVWVDSANLVRRMTLDYTEHVSGQTVTGDVQLDFTSYGAQPVPSAPPASEVSSLNSLISSLGGLAG